MSTTFLAVGSFLIRSRNLFVVVGDVLEGEVRAGMVVGVSLGNITLTTTVASVEVIEVVYQQREYLGLAFAFTEADELEFWHGLHIGEEPLTLHV